MITMRCFLKHVAPVALAFAASSCDTLAKGQLKIRPQEAFSDPNQIALAIAAETGDVGAIDHAVKAGADVKALGKRNATALWYALISGEKGAFAHLLELGADPNTPNDIGEPLLGYCVMAVDLDYLKLALAHGGNPNAANTANGLPVMFRAVSDDSNQKLELLLAAGGDINMHARDGSTPVLFASSARQMKKVLFLLQHGADPFARDEGESDIAAGIFGPNWGTKTEAYQAREQVIKLLESRGIKFDWSVIETAHIRNLAEATGKEPPRWLKRDKELNPEWVKANPEKAEQWYQAVLGRHAPKY